MKTPTEYLIDLCGAMVFLIFMAFAQWLEYSAFWE